MQEAECRIKVQGSRIKKEKSLNTNHQSLINSVLCGHFPVPLIGTHLRRYGWSGKISLKPFSHEKRLKKDLSIGMWRNL